MFLQTWRIACDPAAANCVRERRESVYCNCYNLNCTCGHVATVERAKFILCIAGGARVDAVSHKRITKQKPDCNFSLFFVQKLRKF